jgi:sn-glycerol 3-phosphate transport system ATP-binding protein
MAQVDIVGITKAFGATKVLHGIDCSFADGEFIVILGPSGCGKSTLLRIIAGLERQTSGDIAIGGKLVSGVEPADRNIAMVFQNYALYPHMSVYENMAYGLKVRGLPRADIEARVQKAATMLELSGLLDRKPRQLSGGQRQRVAMGRAIVRDPYVFLFDEPLSNLDAKLRVQMRLEIKKLHQSIKVTSVYVTHDQVEAMTLADRIIVMNAGRAEQIGTPMDVYLRPQTTFVAGFIGAPAMNLLNVTVGPDGRSLALPDGTALGVDRPGVWSVARGVLGVRPESIALTPNGAAALSINGRVGLIEPLGAETLVHVAVADGHAEMVVRIAGETHLASGASVTLYAPHEAVHRFSTETGQRLTA